MHDGPFHGRAGLGVRIARQATHTTSFGGGLEVCLLMACWAALSDMFERSAWPVMGRLLVDDCGDNCLARDHSPLTKFPSRLVMDRFMESSYP
jgi:hypothetical protein